MQLGVIATPDIHSFELTDREHFIILGCDGLWGVSLTLSAIDTFFLSFLLLLSFPYLFFSFLLDLFQKNSGFWTKWCSRFCAKIIEGRGTMKFGWLFQSKTIGATLTLFFLLQSIFLHSFMIRLSCCVDKFYLLLLVVFIYFTFSNVITLMRKNEL